MTDIHISPPPAGKPVTEVAIILDSSGSMKVFNAAHVVAVFNGVLERLQADKASDNRITLVVFGETDASIREVCQSVPVSHVQPMSPQNYLAMGGTPLFQAVGQTINNMASRRVPAKGDAFLVYVITDGQEMHSSDYWRSGTALAVLIRAKMAEDCWTFSFQVPKGYGSDLIRRLGIPSGNVQEWEQTDVGIQEAVKSNNAAVDRYVQTRAAGGTKSVDYYGTTDLSKIKSKDIKKLTDMTSGVKLHEVKGENPVTQKPWNITDFANSKVKKGGYVTGAWYYELIKPAGEIIQARKAVLILDRESGKIYGGPGARELVGLPPVTTGQQGKIKPGDHGKYAVFIQSTSSNRILPRGTRVIHNLGHAIPSQPTWVAPPAKTAP